MTSLLKLALVLFLSIMFQFPAAARAADMEKKPAAPGKDAQRGDRVDLNSASLNELKSIRGLTEAQAKKIVDGRPYARRRDLVTKKVMDQETYDKIKDRVYTKRSS